MINSSSHGENGSEPEVGYWVFAVFDPLYNSEEMSTKALN